jgi:IS5 family transposase
MMVYFRKRLAELIVNDCNERIVRHGLNVIRSAESEGDEDNENDSALPSSDQPAQDGSDEVSANQGTLLIDATCVPADIRYPTDLK